MRARLRHKDGQEGKGKGNAATEGLKIGYES